MTASFDRALFLLASACLFAPTPAQDPAEAAGDHVKVVCHFGDQRIAKQALEVGEAAWKVSAAMFGKSRQKVAEPFTVHLYRDKESYEFAEQKVTEGRNKEALAFAHLESRSALIAVQPEISDDFLALDGLNHMTKRRLATQVAHLARLDLAANAEYFPEWFTLGSAEWIGGQALRDLDDYPDCASDPYLSTLLLRGQATQKAAKLPSPAEIVNGEDSALEDWRRAAIHCSFVDFMMQKKNAKKLTKGIANVVKLGDKAYESKKVAIAFDKGLRCKSLEKPFEKWVKELSLAWNEPYPSLETHGDDWTQVAGKETSALAWQVAEAGPKPYAIVGNTTIIPTGAQQMNLYVGSSGGGYIMVGFAAGRGVYVWEYKASGDEWQRLGEAKHDAVVADKPIPFEVTWDRKRELTVKVAGDEVFKQKLVRAMSGAWGLGAQPESCGRWSGVKIVRS